VASCGGKSDDSIWVSTVISGQNCGDDGRSAKRVINTKLVSGNTPETCYEPGFFHEFYITRYLQAERIVPLETQCGIVQTVPVTGVSPFFPDRAYHFKVSGDQGRALVDSGKFTTQAYYDETEVFFELSCDTFGLVQRP
jgi:hypothetical protein